MNANEEKPTRGKAALWMDIAWEECRLWDEEKWDTNNIRGYKRAQEYVDITGERYSAKSCGWCACFIDWVLKKTNERKGTHFSTVILNPSSSQNYACKERYPGGRFIKPMLTGPPYGLIAVLHSSGWQGHVGFVVNFKSNGEKKYVHLLGGNQNDKVSIQEFEIYRTGKIIYYETKKGTIYTLKGYVYPMEYDLNALGRSAHHYEIDDYLIELVTT